jgi:hypothetical protein
MQDTLAHVLWLFVLLQQHRTAACSTLSCTVSAVRCFWLLLVLQASVGHTQANDTALCLPYCWYLHQPGDCVIHLSATSCCAFVPMDGIEQLRTRLQASSLTCAGLHGMAVLSAPNLEAFPVDAAWSS